jgi:hypothetical protein
MWEDGVGWKVGLGEMGADDESCGGLEDDESITSCNRTTIVMGRWGEER